MNSSLHETSHSRHAAKPRKYRQNSACDNYKNTNNINILSRGGGSSLARTRLSRKFPAKPQKTGHFRVRVRFWPDIQALTSEPRLIRAGTFDSRAGIFRIEAGNSIRQADGSSDGANEPCGAAPASWFAWRGYGRERRRPRPSHVRYRGQSGRDMLSLSSSQLVKGFG
jgi:hypothetical protein